MSGGNADDTLNPVKKALRRAEARPRNMAKSMEDILTSLSPREHSLLSSFSTSSIAEVVLSHCDSCFFVTGQNRRQDPTAEIRHISDGENFRRDKTFNWSKCFSISFVSSAPLPILIFGSRSPEEEQISSDGPTGGGKAAPALQYPVGQSLL